MNVLVNHRSRPAFWLLAFLAAAVALVPLPASSQDSRNTGQGMNAPAGGEEASHSAPEKKAVARKHRASHRRAGSARPPVDESQSAVQAQPEVIFAPGRGGIGITIGR